MGLEITAISRRLNFLELRAEGSGPSAVGHVIQEWIDITDDGMYALHPWYDYDAELIMNMDGEYLLQIRMENYRNKILSWIRLGQIDWCYR